jgi:hypothetical protein
MNRRVPPSKLAMPVRSRSPAPRTTAGQVRCQAFGEALEEPPAGPFQAPGDSCFRTIGHELVTPGPRYDQVEALVRLSPWATGVALDDAAGREDARRPPPADVEDGGLRSCGTGRVRGQDHAQCSAGRCSLPAAQRGTVSSTHVVPHRGRSTPGTTSRPCDREHFQSRHAGARTGRRTEEREPAGWYRTAQRRAATSLTSQPLRMKHGSFPRFP